MMPLFAFVRHPKGFTEPHGGINTVRQTLKRSAAAATLDLTQNRPVICHEIQQKCTLISDECYLPPGNGLKLMRTFVLEWQSVAWGHRAYTWDSSSLTMGLAQQPCNQSAA